MTPDAKPVCQLCGEPMPAGEEMFNYHGYSGNCPKPPVPAPMSPPSATADKATPRPWHVDRSDKEADIHSAYGMVAKTMGHPNNQDAEGRANALLICQAVHERAGLLASNEAMREALALIVNVYNHGGIPLDEHFDKIKAALAQARGESQEV